MATEGEKERTPVLGLLNFEERPIPYLLDVSSLLYDVELLHDLGVILWYPQYSAFKFGRYFWYRAARPIEPIHRLRARRIELKSPLAVELVFGGIAAAWAFAQVADKIGNWGLNRKKLQLEIEKLEAERNVKLYQEAEARARLEAAIIQREAADILLQVARRLEGNPMRLIDIDFRAEDG